MTSSKNNLVDGKGIAHRWLDDIAIQVRALGVPLHLVAVCASDDDGLKAFVKLKQKAAQAVGVEFSAYYPSTEEEATRTIQWLTDDDSVHGIFVELPVPETWNRAALLGLIPLQKDVDLISPEGERSFYSDVADIRPPSVSALRRVLAELNIETERTSAVVIGQGSLVGKPIAHWLVRQGATVSTIDIDTKEPEKISSQADLVVAGTGVPGLVTDEWIKEGATVIDYGYAKEGGEYVGDVHTDAVVKKAGALTPVPGGMGPLVIAATLENLLTLATK